MVDFRLFWQGSTSLHSNFTGTTILCVRKLELPDGKDRIPLRSLVLTQYRSVTERPTDGFALPYTLQRLKS